MISPVSSATLLALQESLFVGQGTTVAYYATLGASPTNHTTPATILSMTTDGRTSTSCAPTASSRSGTAWARGRRTTRSRRSTRNRSFIAYVKDFLIVGNKNILLNINNPGAVVTIYTHPLSAYTWRTATDGQVAIYLLGGAGDRWNIHRMSIANTGATLDPPIVAATLPDGEIAYALGTYLGYLLIGVHYGWRFATTDSSGEVTFGRIVQTSEPVRCFEGRTDSSGSVCPAPTRPGYPHGRIEGGHRPRRPVDLRRVAHPRVSHRPDLLRIWNRHLDRHGRWCYRRDGQASLPCPVWGVHRGGRAALGGDDQPGGVQLQLH